MRRLFFLVLIGITAAGGYWLYKNKRKELLEMAGNLQSYPPAKTAEECANYFIKAINARDYKSAAKYCTPAYAAMLNDAAADAAKLGERIDGLMDKLKLFPETDTPEARLALFLLDPFPVEALEIKVTSINEDESRGDLRLNPKRLPAERVQDAMPQNYKVDPDLPRALYWGLGNNVKLIRKKEKESLAWFLDFTPRVEMSRSVNALKTKADVLGQELRDLSSSVNNDVVVRKEFAKQLRDTIEKATLR